MVQTGGTFSSNLLPNAGPFGRAQVHKTLVAGNIYAYYIDLAATVTLNAPGSYAISVVNSYVGLPFLWACSNTGSSTHMQYVIGQAIVLPASGNLAITLINTAAVTEASVLWMMVVGVGAVWGRTRKGALRHPAT